MNKLNTEINNFLSTYTLTKGAGLIVDERNKLYNDILDICEQYPTYFKKYQNNEKQRKIISDVCPTEIDDYDSYTHNSHESPTREFIFYFNDLIIKDMAKIEINLHSILNELYKFRPVDPIDYQKHSRYRNEKVNNKLFNKYRDVYVYLYENKHEFIDNNITELFDMEMLFIKTHDHIHFSYLKVIINKLISTLRKLDVTDDIFYIDFNIIHFYKKSDFLNIFKNTNDLDFNIEDIGKYVIYFEDNNKYIITDTIKESSGIDIQYLNREKEVHNLAYSYYIADGGEIKFQSWKTMTIHMKETKEYYKKAKAFLDREKKLKKVLK